MRYYYDVGENTVGVHTNLFGQRKPYIYIETWNEIKFRSEKNIVTALCIQVHCESVNECFFFLFNTSRFFSFTPDSYTRIRYIYSLLDYRFDKRTTTIYSIVHRPRLQCPCPAVHALCAHDKICTRFSPAT